jgi:predicted Zn-dependent peptidase
MVLASAAFGAEPAQDTGNRSTGPAADPAVLALLKLRLSIQRVTLENGLRVVLNVDRASPTVAVSVTYNIGSKREQKGRSGFAHLFEHMMFQGSRHVKKGEHFTLITARGGTLNGTTSEDRTNYFETLPMNELALALWLESDRMRWLDVTPENFENQRSVVEEEFRMRVENAAYQRALIRLDELVYEGYWPYAHPAIGSMQDLQAAKLPWVREFFDTYYVPNNAVLSIAGDFDADQAMVLIRRYFGAAKARPDLPLYSPGPAPEQSAERRERMMDQYAKTPGLLYGWRIPDTRTPEHYALDLASMVLADGESSRLYQSLVRKLALARSVSAWTADHPGPDSLTLMVLCTETGDAVAVERELRQELERLAATGPRPEELDKAKNRLRSQFIFGVQSNLHRAVRLGEFEAFYGDARLLTLELSQYLRVSGEEVKKAVVRFLTVPRTNLVEVRPAAQKAKP